MGIGISVIVPAYNAETLFHSFLESLVCQTLSKDCYEVILVDDCSTDATGSICDEYAEAHENFIAIHRETNSGGCSTPRNDGLRVAAGEYVVFADADDWFGPEALERLLRHAREWGSDYVLGRCKNVNLDTCNNLVTVMGSDIPSYTNLNMYDDFELCQTMSAWNRLVRRTTLLDNGLMFDDDILYYEDFVWNLRVLQVVKNACIANDYDYYHLRRDKGAVSMVQSATLLKGKRPEELAKCIDRMFSILEASEYNLKPNHAFWRKLFQHPIRMALEIVEESAKLAPDEYPDGGLSYKQEIWSRVRKYYTPEVRMQIPLDFACRFDAYEAGLGLDKEEQLWFYKCLKRRDMAIEEAIGKVDLEGVSREPSLGYLSGESFARMLSVQTKNTHFYLESVGDANPMELSGVYAIDLHCSDDVELELAIADATEDIRVSKLEMMPVPWGEQYQERGNWNCTVSGFDPDEDIFKRLRLRARIKGELIAETKLQRWDSKLGRPVVVNALQDTKAKLAKTNGDLADCKAKLKSTKKELKEAKAIIERMQSSRSWRMTQGFRKVLGHDD